MPRLLRLSRRARLAAVPATLLTVGALAACGALPALPALPGRGPGREIWAFTAPWDPHSAESVRANAARLDAVVFGWIALDSTTGQPTPALDTLARLAPPGTRRMALVTSWSGDRFHPETVRRLAADRVALARAAGTVARRARDAGYRGLVLDFEGHTRADLPATVAAVRAIADSARAAHVGPITVAIPATDTSGYPAAAFTAVADYVLVMLYDEHWLTSPPGTIASPTWVRSALGLRAAEVGPSRLVAALPLYGYRWPRDRPATPVSFEDARRAAAAAGTELARDPATQTLRAARTGEWEIWVADAGLVAALLREVDGAGVRRVALWRLGQEDPALWRAIGR